MPPAGRSASGARRMRRLLFLAPVAVFVAVLVGFFAGLGRDPTLLPSMMIDKPVPAFNLPAVRPDDVLAGLSAVAGLAHAQAVRASNDPSSRFVVNSVVAKPAAPSLLRYAALQSPRIEGMMQNVQR